MSVLHQASCVAISGRALLIEGPPGSGKSSLALGLIDRGAVLIGDDGIMLQLRDGRLYASPAPQIAGLLEVRNLGLLNYPCVSGVPAALIVRLNPEAPRFIERAEQIDFGGVTLPAVELWPGGEVLAIKAELALAHYGLP